MVGAIELFESLARTKHY